MDEPYLREKLISFKKIYGLNHEYKYLDSVIVTHVDNIKNGARVKYSFIHKVFFVFIFYTVGLAFIGLLFIENILRLLFSKHNEGKNYTNSWLVSFGNSHKAVLEKIPFELEGNIYSRVTSRGLKEALKVREDDMIYVDSFNSIVLTFIVLFRQVKEVVMFGQKVIRIIDFFGVEISNSAYLKLILSYLQSVRFRVWITKLNEVCRPNLIFLGNDTCYRAYWIIKSNTQAKAITVQHGLIENKIMYFSISDLFLCWDSLSLDLIWKNPDTEYGIVGYPKNKTSSNENIVSQYRNNKSLVIVTKLYTISAAEKLLEFLHAFEGLNIPIDVKLHPLERKNITVMFKENNRTIQRVDSWGSYKYIFVVGSSIAIDINAAGFPIIPVSNDKNSAFDYYYAPRFITDITREIINLKQDNEDVDSFFEKEQKMIELNTPNTKFLADFVNG